MRGAAFYKEIVLLAWVVECNCDDLEKGACIDLDENTHELVLSYLV